MVLKAHIRDDWAIAGVGVVFSDSAGGDLRAVWAPGQREHGIVASSNIETDVQPLRMSDEEGRVLLAALLRHYEGSDDLRALRKDYDAERARVDTLINYAMDSARKP